jgi:hypothetical protein
MAQVGKSLLVFSSIPIATAIKKKKKEKKKKFNPNVHQQVGKWTQH